MRFLAGAKNLVTQQLNAFENDPLVKSLVDYSEFHVTVKDSVERLTKVTEEIERIHVTLLDSLLAIWPSHDPRRRIPVQLRTSAEGLAAVRTTTDGMLRSADEMSTNILKKLELLAQKYRSLDAATAREVHYDKKLEGLRTKKIQIATPQTAMNKITRNEEKHRQAITEKQILEESIRNEARQQVHAEIEEASAVIMTVLGATIRYFRTVADISGQFESPLGQLKTHTGSGGGPLIAQRHQTPYYQPPPGSTTAMSTLSSAWSGVKLSVASAFQGSNPAQVSVSPSKSSAKTAASAQFPGDGPDTAASQRDSPPFPSPSEPPQALTRTTNVKTFPDDKPSVRASSSVPAFPSVSPLNPEDKTKEQASQQQQFSVAFPSVPRQTPTTVSVAAVSAPPPATAPPPPIISSSVVPSHLPLPLTKPAQTSRPAAAVSSRGPQKVFLPTKPPPSSSTTTQGFFPSFPDDDEPLSPNSGSPKKAATTASKERETTIAMPPPAEIISPVTVEQRNTRSSGAGRFWDSYYDETYPTS